MEQPSWVLILIISLVLSIPIGIFINIVTPNVRESILSRLRLRAVSSKSKDLADLEKEYERVKKLKSNPQFFYATFAQQTLQAIGGLFLVIVILLALFIGAIMASTLLGYQLLLYVVFAFTGSVVAFLGFYAASRSTLDIYRVIDFDLYEAGAVKRIEELKNQITTVNK